MGDVCLYAAEWTRVSLFVSRNSDTSVRLSDRLADISLFKSVLVHPTFESSSASTIVEHLRTRLQRDDAL